jgi:excisionase family DNA binding protein
VTGLLTVDQAAERLGCSTATVRRRIASGALPVFRDGPQFVRIREDDLRRYIAERVTRASARSSTPAAGVTLAAGARLWD